MEIALLLRNDTDASANRAGETDLDRLSDELMIDGPQRTAVEQLLPEVLDIILLDGPEVWSSLQGLIRSSCLKSSAARVLLRHHLETDQLGQAATYLVAERVYLSLGGLVPIVNPLLRADVKGANPLEALSLVSEVIAPRTIERYFVSLAPLTHKPRDAVLVGREFMRICRRLGLAANGGLQAFHDAVRAELRSPMVAKLGFAPDAFDSKTAPHQPERHALRLPVFLDQLAIEAEDRRTASMSFAEAA